MEFDTFYQYFLYSKSWAYILLILTPPAVAIFWNTLLYPTKDKDILDIVDRFKAKFPKSEPDEPAQAKASEVKAEKSA